MPIFPRVRLTFLRSSGPDSNGLPYIVTRCHRKWKPWSRHGYSQPRHHSHKARTAGLPLAVNPSQLYYSNPVLSISSNSSHWVTKTVILRLYHLIKLIHGGCRHAIENRDNRTNAKYFAIAKSACLQMQFALRFKTNRGKETSPHVESRLINQPVHGIRVCLDTYNIAK